MARESSVETEPEVPESPLLSPTQPDRIKLLEDGRKYRGSTPLVPLSRGGTRGEDSSGERAREDDRVTGWCLGGEREVMLLARKRRMKDEEERCGPGTLFYSFFGPVVALMSSYAWRGRDRFATRPGITSRACPRNCVRGA
jgi:hypothetical protein